MSFAPQFQVTIVCHPPWRPMMGSPSDLEVITVAGDYETVSKALGPAGSDVRDQLDRFVTALKGDEPLG